MKLSDFSKVERLKKIVETADRHIAKLASARFGAIYPVMGGTTWPEELLSEEFSARLQSDVMTEAKTMRQRAVDELAALGVIVDTPEGGA